MFYPKKMKMDVFKNKHTVGTNYKMGTVLFDTHKQECLFEVEKVQE